VLVNLNAVYLLPLYTCIAVYIKYIRNIFKVHFFIT